MQSTKESEFFKELGITFDKVIGEGGYGILYLVYHEQYKSYFAMKKIPEKRFNQAEIDCLKNIDHPNIVSLYKYYFFNGFVYLLMEYCPVDLSMILQKQSELDEEILRKYVHDILLAIKACHDRCIAHSDIKPSNFLIDKYGRIKVCDFCFSDVYENCSCQMYCGTLLFIAPEVLKKQEYNPMKADIWALGVTLYYMATK